VSSPNSQHPRSPSPPPAVQPPSSAQHWHSSACKTDEVTPHPMAEVTFVNSEHCCRSRATNPHQVTKSPSPVPHHHTPPSCTHPPPPAPDVRSLLSVTGHKPAPSHQVTKSSSASPHTSFLHTPATTGTGCSVTAVGHGPQTRTKSPGPVPHHHTPPSLCVSPHQRKCIRIRENAPRIARSPTNLTLCINHDADRNWDGNPIRVPRAAYSMGQ